MKRDFDLIRELMLAIENTKVEEIPSIMNLQISHMKHHSKKIEYHVALLNSAEYAECHFKHNTEEWESVGLTWIGQEFLAKIKNDGIWELIKRVSQETGLNISETMINEVFNISTDGIINNACNLEMKKNHISNS